MNINGNYQMARSTKFVSSDKFGMVTGSKPDKSKSSSVNVKLSNDDYSNVQYNIEFQNKLRKLKLESSNVENENPIISKVKNSLHELKSNIQNMMDLANSAYDKTLTVADRDKIQNEIEMLKNNVDKISGSDEFKQFSKMVDDFEKVAYSNPRLSSNRNLADDFEILKSISQNSVSTLELENINVYSDKDIEESINSCRNAINKIYIQQSTLEKYEDIMTDLIEDSDSAISKIKNANSLEEIL